MPWDWAQIRDDWLLGGELAYSPEVVVDAFDRVERLLGAASIEERRRSGQGTYPTLSVVCDGLRLSALDGVSNPARLLTKVRRGDPDAWAELEGLYILRDRDPAQLVDIYPAYEAAGAPHEADFRIKGPDDTGWTYVEVTRPEESAGRKAVGAVNGHLKVSTGGREKSPPLGRRQAFVDGPPALVRASFIR